MCITQLTCVTRHLRVLNDATKALFRAQAHIRLSHDNIWVLAGLGTLLPWWGTVGCRGQMDALEYQNNFKFAVLRSSALQSQKNPMANLCFVVLLEEHPHFLQRLHFEDLFKITATTVLCGLLCQGDKAKGLHVALTAQTE